MKSRFFVKIAVLAAIVYATFRLGSMYTKTYVIPIGMFVFFVVMLILFPPKEHMWEDLIFKAIGKYDSKHHNHSHHSDRVDLVKEEQLEPLNPDDFYYCENTSLVIKDHIFEYFESDVTKQNVAVSCLLELNEKTPVFEIVERGEVVASYRLDNYDNEDFSGCCLFLHGVICCTKKTPFFAGEGVVIESPDYASFEAFRDLNRIVYRFEKHCIGSDNSEIDGFDLEQKELRFASHITPANVRCVGICNSCKQSFVFNTWNYPMAHAEPVYSDDGLLTAKVAHKIVDKQNWNITLDGVTYRYYNSFRCIHCGAPYIDYEKHRELKREGNLGCVHFGKRDRAITALSELRNESVYSFDTRNN